MVGLASIFFSLESLSFLYLFLSFAIYFLTVLELKFSLLLGLCLFLGGLNFYRQLYRVDPKPIHYYFSGRWALPILLYLALWIWDSGQGAFTGQSTDHLKHNAMLNSLMHFDWPVFHPYQHDADHGFYLVYYLGYYIYPALVGKLTGDWFTALHSHFFFTFIGLALILGWVSRILKGLPWWTLFFLIFFAGFDVISFKLMHGRFEVWPKHIEFWSHPWQFSGNHTLLFWVPQHMIAGWLPTAILFCAYHERWSLSRLLVWPSLSFWWSAFTPIGLIPFLGLILFRKAKQFHFSPLITMRDSLSIENFFLGAIPTLICVLNYTGLLMDVPAGPIPGKLMSWAEFTPRAIFFWLSEAGLYTLALGIAWKSYKNSERALLVTLGMTAFLCLFYRMGVWNDFCMRASIPILFGIQLMMMDLWNRPWKTMGISYAKLTTFALFLVGMISSINELQFSYSPVRPTHILAWDALHFDPQYLSSSQTFFFKKLVREKRGSAREIDAVKASQLTNMVKDQWKEELRYPNPINGNAQ